MSEGETTQDLPEQSPEQPQPVAEQSPLVSDPEAQQLLKQVSEQMGSTQEDALRRSLQTILVMYQSVPQGGQPIIRYKRTKTEQQINLPGATK